MERVASSRLASTGAPIQRRVAGTPGTVLIATGAIGPDMLIRSQAVRRAAPAMLIRPAPARFSDGRVVQAREASTAHVNTFVRGPAWSRRTLTIGSRRVLPNGSSQMPTPPPLTAPSRIPSGTCGRRFTFGDRTDRGRRAQGGAATSGERGARTEAETTTGSRAGLWTRTTPTGKHPSACCVWMSADRGPGVVVLLALAGTPVGQKHNDDQYQGRQRKGPGPVSHGNGTGRGDRAGWCRTDVEAPGVLESAGSRGLETAEGRENSSRTASTRPNQGQASSAAQIGDDWRRAACTWCWSSALGP